MKHIVSVWRAKFLSSFWISNVRNPRGYSNESNFDEISEVENLKMEVKIWFPKNWILTKWSMLFQEIKFSLNLFQEFIFKNVWFLYFGRNLIN